MSARHLPMDGVHIPSRLYVAARPHRDRGKECYYALQQMMPLRTLVHYALKETAVLAGHVRP